MVKGRDFPSGFKFGAATAAYQVEGAWNVSDKTPSIWDTFVHKCPESIADHSTGDVACDSYHQWKEDVQIASDLGLHFYRFSIAWTRLMPSGFPNRISEDGKRYYNNLIDALLEKGIEPVVTLFHYDLPQTLQDLGGWANPLVVDWFADYARVAYTLFGDRVKTWLTLNEPIIFCDVAYSTATYAPGIYSPGIGNYLCIKHALLAHAKAWRLYDEEFKSKYNGKVSLANSIIWLEPESKDDEDVIDAAREYMAIYSYAIYSKEGGWPPLIEKIIAEKSKREGFTTSRLPAFTREEIEFIKGTYDFFAINYYTARTVRKAKDGEQIGTWPLEGAPELGLVLGARPEWQKSESRWLYVYPEGLRLQLAWLKEQYGDIEILITENGYTTKGCHLDDQDRIQYYKDHLEQILLSIGEDDVKVIGYTAWTMMDNFEWIDGYRIKLGLYQVDFKDPQRPRTPRASAHFYAGVIEKLSLDVDYNYKFSDEL